MESINPFGKQQTSIDLKSDEIITNHLKASGVVYACASEEKATLIKLNEEGTFVVSYDPIDGNNVLDVNMSVASIFGIWKSRDIEGSTGRDLVGAACAVYGSRTSIILYNSQSKKVDELTLLEVKNQEKWVVTQPSITISQGKASLFSPGLRSCYDIPELLDVFKKYCC